MTGRPVAPVKFLFERRFDNLSRTPYIDALWFPEDPR